MLPLFLLLSFPVHDVIANGEKRFMTMRGPNRNGCALCGLAISAQLIQLHGGRIGVHSKVGEGSTFYFTVPVYQKTPVAAPDRRLILAIDDDPQVIALYERYLASHGYQIVGLTEPRQAVEQALRLKPFAITLDIMMPGYDGWQVLIDLKSNPETRNIPVIICSILDEREKGFSLGSGRLSHQADSARGPCTGPGSPER
jgi:CheY-like chemotaxis protein